MTVEDLKALQASGEFHHATYRNTGTVWEGLYIYKRDPNGLRGFSLAGSFNNYYRQRNPVCEEAMALVKGLHVGSFGNG